MKELTAQLGGIKTYIQHYNPEPVTTKRIKYFEYFLLK